MKFSGGFLQLNAVLLLMAQLILTPWLFGAENFALAMLLLTPAYIAQGFFEPICQAHFFLKKRGTLFWSFMFLWLAAVIAIFLQLLVFSSADAAFLEGTALALHSLTFLTLTYHTAVAFGKGELKRILASQFLGILGYIASVALGADQGHLGVIFANLAMSIVGVLVLAKSVRRAFPCYSIFSARDFYEQLIAGGVRAPTIFLNSVTVILVGFFSSPLVLAYYRVTISSVNALKYITPYNANQIILNLASAMRQKISGGAKGKIFSQLMVVSFFWMAGSICVVFVFPYYAKYVFKSSALPDFWWMIPISGVFFQLLQPLIFFLKENASLRLLLIIIAAPCVVSVPLYAVNPFIAFFANCTLIFCAVIFSIRKLKLY